MYYADMERNAQQSYDLFDDIWVDCEEEQTRV